MVERAGRIVRELEASAKRRLDWVGTRACFALASIAFSVACENRESVNSLVLEAFSEFPRRKNSYISRRGAKLNRDNSTEDMIGFVRILDSVICSRGFQRISNKKTSYISHRGAKPNQWKSLIVFSHLRDRNFNHQFKWQWIISEGNDTKSTDRRHSL